MKLSIIGTGNVAFQLGHALKEAGHTIVEVYGSNDKNVTTLAKKLKSSLVHSVGELHPVVDVILIAVTDSAIEKVVSRIPITNAVIVHTSGSIPLDVLKKYFKNCGVIYPIQTILKNVKQNFKTSPFFIEGSNKRSLEKIFSLARSLSTNIHTASSKQRAALHLSAVFANNFVNHMMAISYQLMKENKLRFDVFLPMIKETFDKAEARNPFEVQTGPAKRGEMKIIKKHLSMLAKYPEYKNIYNTVSKSIIHYYSKNK